MKIYGNGNGPVRPDRPNEVHRKQQQSDKRSVKRSDGQPQALNDRVDISPAGRQRSDRMHALPIGSPERLGSIRDRVLSGAYEADDVVAEVARRILDRGDV